jgi:hypothetical protein
LRENACLKQRHAMSSTGMRLHNMRLPVRPQLCQLQINLLPPRVFVHVFADEGLSEPRAALSLFRLQMARLLREQQLRARGRRRRLTDALF